VLLEDDALRGDCLCGAARLKLVELLTQRLGAVRGASSWYGSSE
jgi:hypothetical protein